MDAHFAAWAYVFLALLALLLLVCWIVLPFAVIGTKGLLRQLILEQQVTQSLIETQTRAIEDAGPRGAGPRPVAD